MPFETFAGLPDHARLYVFGASRPLDAADANRIQQEMDPFVGAWKAHGAPVAGAWQIAYERFLLVVVDEDQTALSGCSIDSLTRVIKTLEADLGVALFDGGRVFFRDDRGIHAVPRAEFAEMARAGRVSADTIVFNNTLQNLRPLRDGLWEVPARSSWHAAAFSLASLAPGLPTSPGVS